MGFFKNLFCSIVRVGIGNYTLVNVKFDKLVLCAVASLLEVMENGSL